METAILIEPVYQVEQYPFRCICRKMEDLAVDTDFLAGTALVPHVDRGGGIIAYQDGCQRRGNAMLLAHLGYIGGNLSPDRYRSGRAIKDLRHWTSSLAIIA